LKNKLTEEKSVEEKAVAEKPAEEKPVEEKQSTEEKPAEQTEKPADSVPVDAMVLEEPVKEGKQEQESKRKPNKVHVEDPFTPFPRESSTWAELVKFYGIKPEFPVQNLWVRSDKMKKIYFVSETVSNFVNFDDQQRLKIINTGIKLFVRHDNTANQCSFRISQDGIQSILPFLDNTRLVHITEDDFVKLLSDKTKQLLTNVLCEKTRDSINGMDGGCCVFLLKDSSKIPGQNAFVGWKGKNTCHLLLPKEEANAMKNLFGLPIDDKKKNQQKGSRQKQAKQAPAKPASQVVPEPAVQNQATESQVVVESQVNPVPIQEEPKEIKEEKKE